MEKTYQQDDDVTFDFPSKLFKHRFGFGIDFGCSAIKVVYTTEEGDHIRVHTANFSRLSKVEALQFLKTICDGKLEPGGSYHTSGVGIGEYLEEIESVLNIKCEISTEFSNLLSGFAFLSANQRFENFVYPSCEDARKMGRDNAKSAVDFYKIIFPPDKWEKFPFLSEENEAVGRTNTVKYPVILSQVGSGHYLFKIESDKKCKFMDNYTIAGRTLQGLGSLLTGAKTYSEIMDLASRGDPGEVDQTIAKSGVSDTDESHRGANTCTNKIFSFGFASPDKNKDDHKKEDIAAALRSLITNSVAQDAFNWSILEDVRQVFFIGSVVNDKIVKQEIEREFMQKSYGNSKGHACDCLFVKAGGHLAALGTLFSNLEIL